MAKKKKRNRKRKYTQKVSKMTPERALTIAVTNMVKKHGYIEPHGYRVRRAKRRRKQR
jgi:hypothetical protein